MTRADRQRRRAAAVWAACALVHVAVLGLLARYTPALHPLLAATPDFQIELVPTVPLAPPQGRAEQVGGTPETAPLVTPRTPKQPVRHPPIQTTTPYPLPARGAPLQTPRPPTQLSTPTPPAPTPPLSPHFVPGAGALGPAAGGAKGATGGLLGAPNGLDGEGDGYGGRFRGALRTSVGCDDPDYYNLTKAERAVCARELGVQAAIGAKQYVDPISSAQVRSKYEQDRQACERLNHYATPLDSDREHSASSPQMGLSQSLRSRLGC